MTDHKPTHRQDIRPRYRSARSSMYVPMNRSPHTADAHKTVTQTTKKPSANRGKLTFVATSLRSVNSRVKHSRRRVILWWKKQDARYRWKWRAANVFAALLILTSVVTPVVLELQKGKGYQLSNATLDLVGKTNNKLTSKLTYDAKTKTYQFNKESIKEFNPVDQLKQQVGTPQQDDKDKALYSLDVPKDMSKGVTY